MTGSTADKARQEVIDTARAMLSGTADLIVGSRRLCQLRHAIGASESDLFLPIIGFESQTDDYPVGDARGQYSDSYLKQVDQEVMTYTAQAKPALLAACQRIIESLAREY